MRARERRGISTDWLRIWFPRHVSDPRGQRRGVTHLLDVEKVLADVLAHAVVGPGEDVVPPLPYLAVAAKGLRVDPSLAWLGGLACPACADVEAVWPGQGCGHGPATCGQDMACFRRRRRAGGLDEGIRYG